MPSGHQQQGKAVDRFHRGVIQSEVGIMMKKKSSSELKTFSNLYINNPGKGVMADVQ